MSEIKHFKVDKLDVHVYSTRPEMGSAAGRAIGDCIRTLLRQKKEISVMFAAAPSQNETLSALIREKDIDWNRINAYHMDEYVGLDPAHPAGFRNFLHRTIFDQLPFKSLHLLNGDAKDIEGAIRDYSADLDAHAIDVCLLGIGENGHIAFNDPGVADFKDPVRVKKVLLDERCRNQQVHDGCFSRLDDVPRYALTVTIPTMVASSYMFCTVPSSTKAEAVGHMIKNSISESCPASILRTHCNASLYTDEAAAKEIL